MSPDVLGRPVELRVVDTRSEKAEAAAAVFRLTEKDKVVALIGNEVSLGACGAKPDQAVVAAKLALSHFSKKTAAIVCDIAQEDSISLLLLQEGVRSGRRQGSIRIEVEDR